ncbi:DUF2937 family protein [Sulfitobacter aestuarii]|uniref:DUF2937 family protein n=1 Tax=Sulfitobacter aestuarii TaxID=2161676 RepID=A0ABW5U2P6_9RHOB
MILRVLTLAGGLASAAALSQFPEFSQQYLQRLGGAVDALGEVVADFDASAETLGLSREAALEQMRGNDFVERRRLDMQRSFARHESLQADLAVLRGSGAFERAYGLPHMRDGELIRATWAAYRPALPLTATGMIFAGAGFLGGALFTGLLLRLLSWPLGHLVGRRKAA